MSSPGSHPPPKMIVLKSSDGDSFELEEEIARESETINRFIEANQDNIQLHVTSEILEAVINYLKRHAEFPSLGSDSDDDLEHYGSTILELIAFDDEFVNVDKAMLFDLILASLSLGIKGIEDLTCLHVANTIKNMTVEEVRAYFNIQGDFNADEERNLRRANDWAYAL